MATRPLRVSASAARAFESCAYQYARTHLAPLTKSELASTPALSFGISIHRAITTYFRRGGYGIATLSDLVGDLRANWDTRHYAGPEEEQAYVDRGLEALRSFLWRPFLARGARVIAIERWTRWPRPVGGVLLSGRLELVCQLPARRLEVMAFKLGRTPMTAEEMSADLQVACHLNLAAIEFSPLEPIDFQLTFRYIEIGKSVSVVFGRGDLGSAWLRIDATLSKVKEAVVAYRGGLALDEAFPRTRGSHCLTCAFRLHCWEPAANPSAVEVLGRDE